MVWVSRIAVYTKYDGSRVLVIIIQLLLYQDSQVAWLWNVLLLRGVMVISMC